MIRIPVEFIAGQVGTGYMLLHDATREVVSVHFDDNSLVPDLPPYAYRCTAAETVVDPVLTLPVDPAPPVPVYTRLTKLQFIDRLGADYIAILTAAKQSVEIEAWLKRFEFATPDADGTSIDLADPRTIYGLNALEAAGILAAGRAAEILNA